MNDVKKVSIAYAFKYMWPLAITSKSLEKMLARMSPRKNEKVPIKQAIASEMPIPDFRESFARFNNTDSPNIQTFLAGIYRKTQVPDAFGPLVVMLVQNAKNPPKTYFDPNEEIGGAILSYLA